MKRCMLILLVLLLVLNFCACGCKHEWEEANCTAPRTCELCKETEGEALDHRWADANCETPKTCMSCGLTEGEALAHSWTDASCETSKTCSVCGLTDGEALGHSWIDATTESPKTCAICAVTEGERIITDPRFITEACQPLFGEWEGQITTTAEENGLTGVEGEIVFDVVFTFYPNGTVTQKSNFADWESTKLLFREYVEKSWYSQAAEQGMDAAAAEEAMLKQYGMTVAQYARDYVDSIDPDAAGNVAEMVYYSEGNTLCMGYSWDSEMMLIMWSIEGDIMTQIILPELSMLQLTRVDG